MSFIPWDLHNLQESLQIAITQKLRLKYLKTSEQVPKRLQPARMLNNVKNYLEI